MKPSLADLATFVSIARHRSFKQASVELGVSPSAVSHALCQLESRLGLKLVNRTTRSVSLTQAGAQLHAQLGTLIGQIDHAVEAVQPFRDQAVGTLRISAARQGARLALAPLVAEFLRRHPCMRIEIHAEDRLANLVEDSFDAGVRLGEFVSENMVAVPLSGKAGFAVAGTPEYFRRHAPPKHPTICWATTVSPTAFPPRTSRMRGSSKRTGKHWKSASMRALPLTTWTCCMMWCCTAAAWVICTTNKSANRWPTAV